MNGDSLRSEFFTVYRSRCHVRHSAASGVADCRYFIDVDAKFGHVYSGVNMINRQNYIIKFKFKE